ncbi:hypothetical protein [Arthrobacter sp. D2-10]
MHDSVMLAALAVAALLLATVVVGPLRGLSDADYSWTIRLPISLSLFGLIAWCLTWWNDRRRFGYMHITIDTAGLLVPVFPVLLIVVLIDGGFRITRKRRRWVIILFAARRIAAIFAAVGSTFACLSGVIYKIEHMAIDVAVNLGFYASFRGDHRDCPGYVELGVFRPL